MGVNDCQCLAARLVRMRAEKYHGSPDVDFGHVSDRSLFDRIVEVTGGTRPRWAAGCVDGVDEQAPHGYLILTVACDGLLVTAQTLALPGEETAYEPEMLEMAF